MPINKGDLYALDRMKADVYAWEGWVDWWDNDEEIAAETKIARRFKEWFDERYEEWRKEAK